MLGIEIPSHYLLQWEIQLLTLIFEDYGNHGGTGFGFLLERSNHVYILLECMSNGFRK